jgi:hypothetical protein
MPYKSINYELIIIIYIYIYFYYNLLNSCKNGDVTNVSFEILHKSLR